MRKKHKKVKYVSESEMKSILKDKSLIKALIKGIKEVRSGKYKIVEESK